MENSGSNVLKKSMQVCRYLFQNRFWTWNTAMVYILLFICISYHVRPVAGFCLDQKIAVTPWIFPFVTSDFMLQILVCAGAVFLLADAPFHNENRLYLLYRTGTAAWQVGAILYMLVTAFVYVVSIWIFTLLVLADVVQFSTEWGKILGTLMQTSAGVEYEIPMTFSYTMFRFTPIEATLYSILLETLCILWLGCIIYAGNIIIGRRTGIMIAAVYLFLDATINAVLPRSIYQYSPLSLSQLRYFNGDLEREGVSLTYAVVFYSVSFILFLIVVLFQKHIDRKKLTYN